MQLRERTPATATTPIPDTQDQVRQEIPTVKMLNLMILGLRIYLTIYRLISQRHADEKCVFTVTLAMPMAPQSTLPPHIMIALRLISFLNALTQLTHIYHTTHITVWQPFTLMDGRIYPSPEHQDNEHKIVPGSSIYTVSVGDVRNLRLINKVGLIQEHIMELPHGSLHSMSAESQPTWAHEIQTDPTLS